MPFVGRGRSSANASLISLISVVRASPLGVSPLNRRQSAAVPGRGPVVACRQGINFYAFQPRTHSGRVREKGISLVYRNYCCTPRWQSGSNQHRHHESRHVCFKRRRAAAASNRHSAAPRRYNSIGRRPAAQFYWGQSRERIHGKTADERGDDVRLV